MSFLTWILDRLKERSTYRGIGAALAAIGLAVAPELWEAIITASLGVVALAEVFFKEKTPEVE